MKRKNDYYYIIKPGIFQRKNEKTCYRSPNGTLLPRVMRISKMYKKTLLVFVQLAKDDLWLLTKKKKKFYAFCVKCRMKTKESANQSKGCDAKLQGL